ncbi:pirin family protein [Actinotalea sp. C106]|uniref:pirin family protein n=1 Tax=Actinotalea sp. C106 TaxID=2908644 RepID=UPI002029930C|nr:pirin family protein [Actinotalea sp. C106]
MTNSERRPQDHDLTVATLDQGVEIIESREVPLGGPRAMTVRRTLPSRQRSLIGAFCFADHYGPDAVEATGGMDVAPHPHTGLQTVTWLFEGRVLHQDALGSVQEIRPGQLNLMTAGRGVCHSEEGTVRRFPDQSSLHGIQLWTALPESTRHGERAFEHVEEVPTVTIDGARVQVFMGALGGATSPARADTPLVAAQVDLPAGARVRLPVEPGFEHGVMLDTGQLHVAGHPLAPSALAYLPPGREEIELVAGDAGARLVLMGGAPFEEDILMWWNFVGREHEEVVEAREQWQAAVRGEEEGIARFGQVLGYEGDPLPAPALPHVRLKSRGRL